MMTHEQLESLRPPHVSPATMRTWYWAKTVIKLWYVFLLPIFMLGIIGDLHRYFFLLPCGAIALSLLTYILILFVCFLRYSLFSMLLLVFSAGLLVSLCIALPDWHKTWLGLWIWVSRILQVVLNNDPEHRAKHFGSRKPTMHHDTNSQAE